MDRTVYISPEKVNDLQKEIMLFVDWWVHIKKTLVPQQQIVSEMKIKGIKDNTTINACNLLLRKGFIRKSSNSSNRTFYVQLRRVSEWSGIW